MEDRNDGRMESVYFCPSALSFQIIKFQPIILTTKGKDLKACTREGMVFEWQKCTK